MFTSLLPTMKERDDGLTQQDTYVLIIDEINRGNLSKIFGELITLVEPSKRKGAKEELEVILPYSGDKFSVPDNLYIIGTMNTADRSLAMMDTALRRRFDFKEMTPKPELFANNTVKGINLSRLLETLNKRIEVLYDREHTLGHAFLFPVFNETSEDKAFVELQSAFKNKIIPLLEEYFYEDWNKIRLVLGDSLKQDESLHFLQKTEDSYTDLFGTDHGLELYEDRKVTYSIKPFSKGSVWDNPQAYKAIYAKESE
ncbi:AAA domain-containing protein [Vibrio sp. RE86]|nr:AAA domain-containing protein [Vibrio sp. RE86]